MRSFRNNNKRSRYRSNGDRNFKRNGESQSFVSNANFQRKSPGRNNQNAAKLIEKYNDLAREALSNGDKILSENYLQHADHFTRILNERESFKRERNLEDKSDENRKDTNEISKKVDVSEKNLEDNSNIDPKSETLAEAN